MPVMDGYEATREIRKDPAFQNLPIISMTANAFSDDRIKVLESGMNDHISKPIQVDVMFATLNKWIKPANPIALSSPPTSRKRRNPSSKGPDLQQLVGIDIETGLSITQQDVDFFWRLLFRFHDAQQSFVMQLNDALHRNAKEDAVRLAHTLKGNAGNIGMQDLMEKARRLEKALEEEVAETEISRLINEVEAELQRVLPPIQTQKENLLQTEKDATPNTKFSEENYQALLAKLHDYLTQDRLDADMAVVELEAMLDGKPETVTLSHIRNAIAHYDFETALERLKELMPEQK